MGAPGINGQRGGSEGEGGFSLLFHPFLASLTNLSADVRDVGGKLGSTLKIVFLGGKSTCSAQEETQDI